jgi:dephospho-CoA kinase
MAAAKNKLAAVVPQRRAVTKFTKLSMDRLRRSVPRRSAAGIDHRAVFSACVSDDFSVPGDSVGPCNATFRDVLIMGLTGGVGSGKSTVGGIFTLYGASLIDADQVAREVVAPKTPGLAAIAEQFGPEFISRTGELDRSALGKLVFADASALMMLNAIVHPLVRARIGEQLEELRERGVELVILMIPLLVESGAYPTDAIIVVDCDPDVVLERLLDNRGWSNEEAKKRIAAQASRSVRLAAADYVIDNSGDRAALDDSVAAAWQWMQGLLAAQRGGGHQHSP